MLTPNQTLRDLLHDGVADGSFSPGDKLPTERELVETLSLPRSAVRRALAQLEEEGIVIRQVGRGTFLTEKADPAGVTRDASPASIMQSRQVLEPPLSALAARNATQSDLEDILDFLAKGGEAHDFDSFESWDASLHRAIAKSANNALLLGMFDVMNSARSLPVWGNRKRQAATPERRDCYHHEHTLVVEALVNRDPAGAEQAMRTHLRTVSDNLLGH